MMKYNVFVRLEFDVEVAADNPSHAVEMALEDIDYKELIDEGKFTYDDYINVRDRQKRWTFTHSPSIVLVDEEEE